MYASEVPLTPVCEIGLDSNLQLRRTHRLLPLVLGHMSGGGQLLRTVLRMSKSGQFSKYEASYDVQQN